MCVANFSEGRRADVIDPIVMAASKPPVQVLDVHSDPDHHRTVLTVAGPSSPLVDAIVSTTRQAADSIDLNLHRGVHPRLGAMDLIPFVPAINASMKDAVDAAIQTAGRISNRLRIPCFLYGAAAKSTERRNLPAIRRMAFKGWAPDFGTKDPHPTAGATIVGARGPLVAFNVNLASGDLGLARRIAALVRESGGGLPHVRTIGLKLGSREVVQVSMNLLAPGETTVGEAFEAVFRASKQEGVAVIECEIVGLVPRNAIGGGEESLLLRSPPKFLEDELARAFAE